MNIANNLQKFIYNYIDNYDNETVYFTSASDLDTIVDNLYNDKNFSYLASILECISSLDRNTYVLENDDQYMLHYIILSGAFLSCMLYYRAGLIQYSSFLAQCNYSYLKEYLDNIENRKSINTDIVKAIYLELLGDFCFLFNRELLEDYYSQAKNMYKNIDDIVQYGEFSDWYWGFAKNKVNKLFKSCYNIYFDTPELGHDRIDYKLSLFKEIG